jgi:hypothetical protein
VDVLDAKYTWAHSSPRLDGRPRSYNPRERGATGRHAARIV